MIPDKKEATIIKELIPLVTYPYSDPSPVPEFGRLYPYNRFDGYTNQGETRQWEMIVLENDHIKLWISPEVGGKIWGAIEKASGKEFIYFNHVAKFRDVAMRGPWTSGGMENNMGIIGHTPSCSSPVDHHMRKNNDGSVSCFIGATDWPSRTTWTVEICLPANAAYFITRSGWYNASGQEQSYYQWNNIGVKVSGNLEYVNPGHQRIGHDGKCFTWPKDESNRNISFYENNNFGEYKSYHIFGSYSDFWGCYWHNDDFGFGHSASYDDKPGKKIWIWGLSRYGMIWEDLLTDTDGQYTEVQSGRLFNQSISASTKTPFKHKSFSPYTFDGWDEYWFPVKNIGGLTYGNPQCSFNLVDKDGSLLLSICANQPLNHSLKIEDSNRLILVKDVVLRTLQTTVLELPASADRTQLKIWLNDDLIYNAGEQLHQLERPVNIDAAYNFNSVQSIYIQAKEWERQRFYERAVEQYRYCLEKDPFYIEALNGLAGLMIRQARYTDALKLVKTALSVDTYHGESNYLYGIINNRLDKYIDAKDGFSIATQSVAYASAAYTELAKIFFIEQQADKSLLYIKKALQHNAHNYQALQLEVIVNRKKGDVTVANELAVALLQANPLDHIARFEHYQLGLIDADTFKAAITSELPYETYLELAAFYFNLKLYDLSLKILELSPEYAMVSIWKAYLLTLRDSAFKAAIQIEHAIFLKPDMVFPHREEDTAVLQWAVSKYPSWKLKYYLALVYTQMLRTPEALQLSNACEDEPDYYAFYLVRANLKRTNQQAAESDLFKAYHLAPQQWRTGLTLSRYLAEQNRWNEALDVIQLCYAKNPDSYYLGLHLAKCLMQTGRFEQSIVLMNKLDVLPNEGASDGRNVWKETHLFAALEAMDEQDWQKAIGYIAEARRWPENLGVGKPYEVDERLENFLEWYCLEQSGQAVPQSLFNSVAFYREHFADTPYNSNDFLSMYLLLQTQQHKKAEDILGKWQKYDADDLAGQWTAAFMNGDLEKLQQIASIEPPKRVALPYEILFEDRSFPFVKQMYSKNFFQGIYKTVN